MASVWSAVPGQENTFTRPLGTLESGFAWDSIGNGVADFGSCFIVETDDDDAHSTALFSEQNIERAWRGLKKVFPLLGASVVRRKDNSGFDFILSEDRVNTVRPGEIVYKPPQSDALKVLDMADRTYNSEFLTDDLLAQVWVVPVLGKKIRHIIFSARHFVADGAVNPIQGKVFMEILHTGKIPKQFQPRGTFLEYLNLHPAVEDLNPARKNLPRLRWRRAIAMVLAANQRAVTTGGHTLPKRKTLHTPETPLRCTTLFEPLTKEITDRTVSTCHKHNFTLGAAMFVISQVAHARLYHRLYAQGLMSPSEWDHRKTEPMHFFGRMTIRPYLDKEWLANGGHVRGCSALSSFPVTLPHMPIAQDSLWDKHASPAPPFHVLLSRKRFFHRCRLAKDQVDKTLKHPLALEFTEILRNQDTEKSKGVAMRWLARGGGARQPPAPPAAPSHIMSGSTSTIGRITSYAPPAGDGRAQIPIRVSRNGVLLHSRPEQFYFFTGTYDGAMQLNILVDISTFDEGLVREWFQYVAEALKWYLAEDGAERTKL